MAKLRDRIEELENKIKLLEDKVTDLTNNTETKRLRPESRVSQLELDLNIMPSTGTGLGKIWGGQGNIFWNDADVKRVGFGTQPPEPTKGYNKHGHSEYAGGALDINTLKLVEYERDEYGKIISSNNEQLNEDCQAYWKNQPKIKKAEKNGELIEKIGALDLAFDTSSGKWVSSAKEMDVERCYLVQYDIDENGNKTVVNDEAGKEKKSSLNVRGFVDRENVVWDKDSNCWRFYAVYADSLEKTVSSSKFEPDEGKTIEETFEVGSLIKLNPETGKYKRVPTENQEPEAQIKAFSDEWWTDLINATADIDFHGFSGGETGGGGGW